MQTFTTRFALIALPLAAAPAAAQLTATALVTEGQPLPGDASVIVDSVGNVATNGVGGWGVSLTDTNSLTRIYATNGSAADLSLLRVEGDTLPDGLVTSVESFFGISDNLDVLHGVQIDGDEAIYRNDVKSMLEPEASPVGNSFWVFGSALT